MTLAFTNPIYLIFLFIIPIFILMQFTPFFDKKKSSLKFANFESIARIKGIDLYSKNLTIITLNAIFLFLIVIAMAGPMINVKKDVSENSFVIAIDSSQSMSATDVEPNRMGYAKELAIKIVDSFPENTKIALISIGTYNRIEQETTTDKEKIKEKINSIEIWGMGTKLYETAIASSNILQNSPGKTAILLSDGQTTEEDLSNAIRYSNENELMFHTILVGTPEGGEVNYGISQANEKTLKTLSEKTLGKYISKEDATEIGIKEQINFEQSTVSTPISQYIILLAIILFFIEYVLSNTKYASKI